MKAVRWLLVLSGLLLATPAPAQVLLGPGACGLAAVSLGRTVVARGRHYALYVRNSYSLGYVHVSPYYVSPRSRVSLFYAYTPPPPSIFVLNLPPREREDLFDDRLDLPPLRRPAADLPRPEPADDRVLPGQPAGGFRPVVPDDRARARRPIAPEPPPQPPPRPEPPPQPAPRPEPPRFLNPDNLPPLPIERPERDPLAEQARQVSLGKQALAQRAYGRAAQHFRQATLVAPQEATGHFLLAEALTALGKYRDAVASIHEGLLLRPDWPAQSFRPRELFDANQPDYFEMIRALDEVLTTHPDDAVLLFLSAYHLWFDGRKDEARPLFQRAVVGGADKGDVERFLLARP